MDHFGIGPAMRGIAAVFFQSARRSGRTTSMLESLKDGDRVVFFEPKEAARVGRLCAQRGLKVECVTVPATQPDRLFERGTPTGRLIFDHTWVEVFYTAALEKAAAQIDHFQRELSGFGTAHSETRQAAEMRHKWQY